MANHFLLLLTTREANLSPVMQGFLTGFSITLNRAQRTSGHVFHGRFKAELVEAERYLSEASRYMHLNPIRTKACRQLDVEERRDKLQLFRWSSFRILTGLAKQPNWMELAPVLANWGDGLEDQQCRDPRPVAVPQPMSRSLQGCDVRNCIILPAFLRPG